jgi:hypothetical protein
MADEVAMPNMATAKLPAAEVESMPATINDSARSRQFTDLEVRMLIKLAGCENGVAANVASCTSSAETAALWDAAAKEIAETCRTPLKGGEQCKRKWINLVQRYRKAKSKNRLSGAAAVFPKWYHEMDAAAASTFPNVNLDEAVDTGLEISQEDVQFSDEGNTSTASSAEKSLSGSKRHARNWGQFSSHELGEVNNKRPGRSRNSGDTDLAAMLRDFADRQVANRAADLEERKAAREERKERHAEFMNVLKNFTETLSNKF